MEFKKILITPTIAKQYLEANIRNRRVDNDYVTFYANQMLDGKWKQDTGECIKISKSGVILDGQHRLLAVIKANKPIFFYIADGLEEDIISVLDTGKSRSASDTFKIEGVKYSAQLPSIIMNYHLFKNKIYYRSGEKHTKLSNSQLLEIYNKNPEYWINIARHTDFFYKEFQTVLTASLIGGLLATLNDIDENKSMDFISQLCTGRNVTNETILVLRNRLIQDKISVSKLPPYSKMIFIVKTWNAFMENKTLKVLKFHKDTEDLPTFKKKP